MADYLKASMMLFIALAMINYLLLFVQASDPSIVDGTFINDNGISEALTYEYMSGDLNTVNIVGADQNVDIFTSAATTLTQGFEMMINIGRLLINSFILGFTGHWTWLANLGTLFGGSLDLLLKAFAVLLTGIQALGLFELIRIAASIFRGGGG